MANRLSAFLALPAAERRIVLLSFFGLPAAVLAIRAGARIPRSALQLPRQPEDAMPTLSSPRIATLVDQVAACMPFEVKCLARSLWLDRMLRRHGHSSRVRIGVSLAAGFQAHAWVECDGRHFDSGSAAATSYGVIDGR